MTVTVGFIKEYLRSKRSEGKVFLLSPYTSELPDDYNMTFDDVYSQYCIVSKQSTWNTTPQVEIPVLDDQADWEDFLTRVAHILKGHTGRLNLPFKKYHLPSGMRMQRMSKYSHGGQFLLVEQDLPLVFSLTNDGKYTCAGFDRMGYLEIQRAGISVPTPWLDLIKRPADLLKNPTNKEYWDVVEYIEPPNPSDLYMGKELWVHIDPGTAFVKLGNAWIDVDADKLPQLFPAMGDSLQEEYKMWEALR